MLCRVPEALIIYESTRLLKKHIWMFGGLGDIVRDWEEQQSSISVEKRAGWEAIGCWLLVASTAMSWEGFGGSENRVVAVIDIMGFQGLNNRTK